MRVFYISDTTIPSQNAQCIHVMKMAEAMAKSGSHITLFTQAPFNATSENIYKIYNTEPCFSLHLSTKTQPSKIAYYIGLKAKIATMAKPDLVFGHDPISLSILASRNTPILFEAHAMPQNAAQHFAFKQLIGQPNFKGVVALSDGLKKLILNEYPEIEAEKVFVAYNGAEIIDTIQENQKQAITLEGRADAFNVGYTGSMLTGKGVELIARLAKIRPEYDFHIIGGSPKKIQRLEAKKKHQNIHFYGFKDHALIPAYLEAFDVCLAPYQHHGLVKAGRNVSRWMSPMKVFEYMAAQKPILASSLPILEEILIHNENAILLPAGDEEQWAQAIDSLKNNTNIRHDIAHNAFQCLKDHYTWDKRARAIISFFFSKENPTRYQSA